jgi:hypothetical protein
MSYIKVGTSDVAGAAVPTADGGVCAVETMAVVVADGDLIRVRGQQAAGVPYKLADNSVIPIRAITLVDESGDAATFPPPVPTDAVRGGVLQQDAIADLAADPTKDDFNGLLAALRTAGILATA